MFGLFGKSRFLDLEEEEWFLETWAWLMTSLGGMDRLAKVPLVVPTREYFPPTEAEGHDRALYIFGRIKSLMGVADWPCELRAYERVEARQRVGHYAMVQRGKTANGTFQIVDGEVIVSYAQDLVDQPRQLIATLAHELAHYLLATIKTPIPGGNDLHELATELTVAYAGFGVFGANAAFRFEQHQDVFGQGWSARSSGYFSEAMWAFAVAIFCELKGVEAPKGQMKDSVSDLTRKAARYLKRNNHLLAPLREIT